MGGIVLDCSVTMAWCFADEGDAYADAVLDALPGAPAVVPALWRLEVSNVLLVAERKRRISAADASRFWSLLEALPIRLDDSLAPAPEVLMALGRAHGLSAYDACYLDLAQRTGRPLATRDERLRVACHAAGVELFASELIES